MKAKCYFYIDFLFFFFFFLKVSYLSNQGFLGGRPTSWGIDGLFLESDSITILILLFGILSVKGQTLTCQFYNTQFKKRSQLEGKTSKHSAETQLQQHVLNTSILPVCKAATGHQNGQSTMHVNGKRDQTSMFLDNLFRVQIVQLMQTIPLCGWSTSPIVRPIRLGLWALTLWR